MQTVNLIETPTDNVPTRKDTTNDDQQFSRVVASGRTISSYSGFLPCTRYGARHIFKCEHLRHIPGERLPYRAHPSFTHQIWIWYRLTQEPGKLYLLFRGQFDFTLRDRDPDWVAEQVSEFLASLLFNCEEHTGEIFRHEDGDAFWALAVERKFKSLSSTYDISVGCRV